MSEGGAHAPGAGDDDRLVRQVRLLTQPCDRALRQVAAGFCPPGPGFPAGGDGGLEQAVEARIPLSPRPGPAQRLADLVQHLILPTMTLSSPHATPSRWATAGSPDSARTDS